MIRVEGDRQSRVPAIRRTEGTKLIEASRQMAVETERLRAALAELVPAAELGEWMRTSNPAFEGQTPIQVIKRGEADRMGMLIRSMRE